MAKYKTVSLRSSVIKSQNMSVNHRRHTYDGNINIDRTGNNKLQFNLR
jgi:hypothetical protein